MAEKSLTHLTKDKPTLADVARLAGVSTATVSYVLNNRSGQVSAQTADTVQRAVRQLGYVKNLTASALSGRKSNMIAVITIGAVQDANGIAEVEINPFFGEFLFRLEAAARKRGYVLCVYGGREEDYVHFLLGRFVDAAVLVGFSEWDLPGVLAREGIHFVMYDSFGNDTEHSHVRTNEVRGGAMAAEHMISHGRKKLVFVGGSPVANSDNIPATRYRGAKKFCDAAGIEFPAIEADTNYSAGVRAAQAIIDSGADGVVTTADTLAAGVINGLNQKGVRVPDDIAVMGYDNLPICEQIHPRLSTIDQHLAEKVHAVVDLIASEQPGQQRVVEPELIVRESA